MGKHIDRQTQYEITNAVLECCSKDPDGFAVYNAGASDNAIACDVGTQLDIIVTREQVATVRRAWCGNFRPGGTVSVASEALSASRYERRLAAVETLAAETLVAVDALVSAIDTQQKLINDLCAKEGADKLGGRGLEVVRPVGPDT